MKAKYDKAEVSVEKISDALQQHQIRLMKDSAMLDQMYDQNLAYFKELTMYILAGKQKLEQVRAGKLSDLEATARRTGLAEDVQAAKDLADKCQRFEKKIYDLELTRAIAMQTAPQIRMIQNNDNVMVEKIQTTLVNTIPLWKNQMVITLGIAHASEAAAAQRQVNDVTNALLQANAKRLHTASVETAKEAERGIVDIETLKKTNAELIQTGSLSIDKPDFPEKWCTNYRTEIWLELSQAGSVSRLVFPFFSCYDSRRVWLQGE